MTPKLILLVWFLSFTVHGDIYMLGGYEPNTPEMSAADNLIPSDVLYIGTSDFDKKCTELQKDSDVDWSNDIVLLQYRDKKNTYATCSRNKLVK